MNDEKKKLTKNEVELPWAHVMQFLVTVPPDADVDMLVAIKREIRSAIEIVRNRYGVEGIHVVVADMFTTPEVEL